MGLDRNLEDRLALRWNECFCHQQCRTTVVTTDEHLYTRMAKQTCNNMVQFFHYDGLYYKEIPQFSIHVLKYKFEKLQVKFNLWNVHSVYFVTVGTVCTWAEFCCNSTIFGPHVQKASWSIFSPSPFLSLVCQRQTDSFISHFLVHDFSSN